MKSFNALNSLLLGTFFLCITLTSFSAAQRNTFASPGALLKCANFQDLRKYNQNGTFFYIPKNRTSAGIYAKAPTSESVKFQLHGEEDLKCSQQQVEERVILFDFKNSSSGGKQDLGPYSIRNFNSAETGVTDPPQRAYFTFMGYFYDDITRIFYKPDGEYCIKSFSQDRMTVDVCVIKEDCSKAPLPGTYCLPKCCAVDEVLSVSFKRCMPLSELYPQESPSRQGYTMNTGVTPWFPPIYQGTNETDKLVHNVDDITQYWLDEPRHTTEEVTNVTFQMAKLPKSCRVAPVSGKGISSQPQPTFEWWSSSVSTKESKTPANDSVRLVLPEGKGGVVRPMLYNLKKKTWEVQSKVEFCVDSVAGMFVEDDDSREYHYTGNDFNFAVIYCVPLPPSVGTTTKPGVVAGKSSQKSGGKSNMMEKTAGTLGAVLTFFIIFNKYRV